MGHLRNLLSEPARIRTLTQSVRAKIPPHDVDDVVQSTLADALSAAAPPLDEEALDRWLAGIARHKVADYYRSHSRREVADDNLDRHDAPTEGHPESARDLLHWVNNELPVDAEAPRTLEWMMREADGDRLESIAAENNLSAPAVRQRVSRLRRYLKERWALQLAAAITLVVVIGVVAYKKHSPLIEPEPTARVESPLLVAQKLRQSALADCRSAHWQTCLEQLDRAKALDPVGDTASTIADARADIARAMQPAPAPTTSAPEERLVPAGDGAKSAPVMQQKEPAPRHTKASSSKSDGKSDANTKPVPAPPLQKQTIADPSSNQVPSKVQSAKTSANNSSDVLDPLPTKGSMSKSKASKKASSLVDLDVKGK